MNGTVDLLTCRLAEGPAAGADVEGTIRFVLCLTLAIPWLAMATTAILQRRSAHPLISGALTAAFVVSGPVIMSIWMAGRFLLQRLASPLTYSWQLMQSGRPANEALQAAHDHHLEHIYVQQDLDHYQQEIQTDRSLLIWSDRQRVLSRSDHRRAPGYLNRREVLDARKVILNHAVKVNQGHVARCKKDLHDLGVWSASNGGNARTRQRGQCGVAMSALVYIGLFTVLCTAIPAIGTAVAVFVGMGVSAGAAHGCKQAIQWVINGRSPIGSITHWICQPMVVSAHAQHASFCRQPRGAV